MIVGACVLPLTMRGMTEASTTRRPAVHAQLSIHHRHAILAHAAGSDRVVDRVGVLANPVFELIVAVRIGRR